MEQVAVIVNPVAGKSDGYRQFALAADVLQERGIHVVSYQTDPDEGARPACEEALEAGHREIWVIGGDGTIRDCLRPVVEADAILGPLPGGTANRFVGALGPHAGDIEERVRWMIEHPVRRVDLGECNGTLFSVHVGVGFEAVAAEKTQEDKSGLGSFAYLIAGFSALREVEPQNSVLRSGGEKLYDGPMISALFSNMPIDSLIRAAEGHVGDPVHGRLSAKVIAEPPGWRMLIRWLQGRAEAPHEDMVFDHAAEEYDLSLERDAEVHVDGESIGRQSALELRCLHQVLRVRGLERDDGDFDAASEGS
ncbi:MAG: diacylglycerol/lipid kinase family protein [Armatimonadota bacterium]